MKRHVQSLSFSLLAIAAVALAACAGTREAYRAAESLDDHAYVITEHYAALVREAADLREQGALTGTRLERVRAADNAVAPAIGALKTAVDRWNEARDASTEAQLQAALDRAAVDLAQLIAALKN